ncbi:hypothetical protein [Paraburkholderia rhynchosiae]|uniref:Uncharacterized protein n=1 Tax=Paraburkholderia rhynchosiae TaxID=487049 RepID=A0A2N7VU40_9BURK|nr:hypothetical protein [Paraburkholderia rhynchosiae]PMS20674.1 hypothetical protein C0Z16_34395 [Paraburkholderia rhynchosiae]CAB3726077.1 hypothetical protein LMG27174_05377 [Paraburkholderia rhynchosiae]
MTGENAEDVSFGVVPGSTGTAGTFAVAWAPRRSPASDRARREALAALDPILSKFRPQAQKRAPARSASIRTARATFFQE